MLNWFFLHVGGGVQLAIPHGSVHNLLHTGSKDYAAFAAGAIDLGKDWGFERSPSMPGVLAVLNSGSIWLVGDIDLGKPGEKLKYLSVGPELFRGSPWCRGVLAGTDRWAFVVEETLAGGGAIG